MLDELQSVGPPQGRGRFLARLDASSLVKSPESILDRMGRSVQQDGRRTIDFVNFTHEMHDLARFRIVANFLSDVELIADHLERPYLHPRDATKVGPQLAAT